MKTAKILPPQKLTAIILYIQYFSENAELLSEKLRITSYY